MARVVGVAVAHPRRNERKFGQRRPQLPLIRPKQPRGPKLHLKVWVRELFRTHRWSSKAPGTQPRLSFTRCTGEMT